MLVRAIAAYATHRGGIWDANCRHRWHRRGPRDRAGRPSILRGHAVPGAAPIRSRRATRSFPWPARRGERCSVGRSPTQTTFGILRPNHFKRLTRREPPSVEVDVGPRPRHFEIAAVSDITRLG